MDVFTNLGMEQQSNHFPLITVGHHNNYDESAGVFFFG